jgi:hypothetical protein
MHFVSWQSLHESSSVGKLQRYAIPSFPWSNLAWRLEHADTYSSTSFIPIDIYCCDFNLT